VESSKLVQVDKYSFIISMIEDRIEHETVILALLHLVSHLSSLV